MSVHNGPLPNADKLRAARALHHWWGIDRLRLAEAGYRFPQEYLSDDKYDPHLDEVAIARALDGDPVAYAALTHYERLAVRDGIRAIMDAPELTEGITDWCRLVGEKVDVIRSYVARARARDSRVAARG